MYFAGTVILVEDTPSGTTTTLILQGDSSRPVLLSSSASLPSQLNTLRLLGGATHAQFENSVSIGVLQAEGDHKMTVQGGATVSVNDVFDPVRGTQCSFFVTAGSTLNLPTDKSMFVMSENPILDVEGRVTGGSVILGRRGELTVHNGGSLEVTGLGVQEESNATFEAGSRVGVDSSKSFKLSSFDVGPKSKVLFVVEDVTLEVGDLTMKWASSLTTTSALKNIKMISTSITILEDAIVDARFGGNTVGTGTGASTLNGASYGGDGGNNEGHVYGSVVQPESYGSGSGGSVVRGGGIVKFVASGAVIIDGSLLTEGSEGGSEGGGSGGSVWITADSLSGHGKISALGGDGGASSGGGSGGRISIEVSASMDDYRGNIEAHGGDGAQPGAAGTIYESYLSVGVQRRDLVIDNADLVTDGRTLVIVPTETVRLNIYRHSVVEFKGLTADVTDFIFDNIVGDSSGSVLVKSGQMVHLSTTFGTTRPFALPCKVNVEEGGQVALPPKVLFTDMSDDPNDLPNLALFGTLSNVRELIVGTNSRVVFSGSSNTAVDSSLKDPVGTVSFNKLDVVSGGHLEVGLDINSTFSIVALEQIQIHLNGHLSGRNLRLDAPLVSLAYKALIEVDGQGSEAEIGPGAGVTTGGQGSGASYGGCGGSSSSGAEPSVVVVGSIYDETSIGSGGGNGADVGGASGGVIQLTCSSKLHLDGMISARGGDAGNTGGGGTGGTIVIDTVDADGAGMVDVTGGAGYFGGGGSGGRVHFKISHMSNFTGTAIVRGGSSINATAGGAGTALFNVIVRNIPYYILIIDNTGVSGADIAHTYLQEGNSTEISVNELQLGSDVQLHAIGTDVKLTAHRLHCVVSSVIHVPDKMIFTADTPLSETTIPCSFNVGEQGEIRLPLMSTFLGKNNVFAGQLLHSSFSVISISLIQRAPKENLSLFFKHLKKICC